MKIIMLVLAFALIIAAGLLFNVSDPEVKAYKNYFWIPIAVSFLLFTLIFLNKDRNDEKAE